MLARGLRVCLRRPTATCLSRFPSPRNIVANNANRVRWQSSPASAPRPTEKFRKDYQPTPYLVESVHLDFQLDSVTTVTSRLAMQRRPGTLQADLQLDGEDLQLVKITLNDKILSTGDYTLTATSLTIPARLLQESFVLCTTVQIEPSKNTQLSGLYESNGVFCTQCEAEGFRRITFYPDRPDVLTKYKVRIEADSARFPVLLSNGNLLNKGQTGARHWTEWEDPFNKPCYLFALVAGQLEVLSESFTTSSGRSVTLNIYSDGNNVDKLQYAMDSLRKAMRWDEDRFGLEYDLDVYNVVAVNDFNMGAMENKSLNVFNSALVFATPTTATDVDFERIERVIGHEYFHNWTGNRVTCRDWFQLTLKEGLTVFRDQLFTADMGSAALKRIEDVKLLKSRQFPEDDSSLAHPIRPDSYSSIDNFYTVTVYEKGAEVIRMLHTMLGEKGFRKGMDLYFKLYDGQAVTCQDFLDAMAAANQRDLSVFANWYSRAGTPVVTVKGAWEKGTYNVTLEQNMPQSDSLPLHIPVSVCAYSNDGKELCAPQLLELKQPAQSFHLFSGSPQDVKLSINRNFSAPIKVNYPRTAQDLSFFTMHDSDGLNRWEAGQELMARVLLETDGPELLFAAFEKLLKSPMPDLSLKAVALQLPDELLLQSIVSGPLDPLWIHHNREGLRKKLAQQFHSELNNIYLQCADAQLDVSTSAARGRRRLRNTCLWYLATSPDAEERCYEHYSKSTCMTDTIAALLNLCDIPGDRKSKALSSFYDFAKKSNELVMDKWFALQASADIPTALEEVHGLLRHPDFSLLHPNRMRSVIAVFAQQNIHFHRPDGAGYEFLADMILQVDKVNPQVAARLAASFARWKSLQDRWGKQMKLQLIRLDGAPGLSNDTKEVVTRSLS